MRITKTWAKLGRVDGGGDVVDDGLGVLIEASVDVGFGVGVG
jgi:hypothetical protein